jgi:hypothetical protein
MLHSISPAAAMLYGRALWTVGSNGQAVKPGPVRGLGQVGQAKWTKVTGWAVRRAQSPMGMGDRRLFSLIIYKSNKSTRIWPETLYFSVLISFPEGVTLGHDRKV